MADNPEGSATVNFTATVFFTWIIHNNDSCRLPVDSKAWGKIFLGSPGFGSAGMVPFCGTGFAEDRSLCLNDRHVLYYRLFMEIFLLKKSIF